MPTAFLLVMKISTTTIHTWFFRMTALKFPLTGPVISKCATTWILVSTSTKNYLNGGRFRIQHNTLFSNTILLSTTLLLLFLHINSIFHWITHSFYLKGLWLMCSDSTHRHITMQQILCWATACWIFPYPKHSLIKNSELELQEMIF